MSEKREATILNWLWNEAFYAAAIGEGYALSAGLPLSEDEAIRMACAALETGASLPVRSPDE